MQRFWITTLGCKVNQYDAQSIADMLCRAGWRPVERGQRADLVLIQTCCVTATAMRKSRQAIRRAIRNHTDRRAPSVCVLGCYGTYSEDKLRQLLRDAGCDPARAIVAPSDSDPAGIVATLFERAHSETPAINQTPADSNRQARPKKNLKRRRQQKLAEAHPGTRGLEGIDRFANHQRAFVKVQDGCDAFCSYCIVPYTRPHVWSRPHGEVLEECRRLINAGHREIVLCGVFLGAYGRETAIRRRWETPQASPLARLLRDVANLRGLWRVRLSSLEPGDLNDELLEALRHPKVAPHLHLPLQSGSPEILKRMNRQYTPEAFRETAQRLRQALDRPALTTDIIVGFPGESEADFQATLELAQAAAFAKIHAFPFSAIEPTLAWHRRNEAPDPDTVRQRLAQLAELETALAETYRRAFLGETIEALVERGGKGSQRRAMTDRYLAVAFAGAADLAGKVVELNITDTTDDGLRGEQCCDGPAGFVC